MNEIRLLNRDKEKKQISFLLKESTPAFANTIRRIVLEKVPTMAIEDIEFRKNNSILYDELIAHRLGLIPLTTDLNSYTLSEKCKCKGKGCARCQLKMTLKAKGPCMVYASDIKTRDAAVKPVFPKTPIAKLLKGQSLELEATAFLGKGEGHSKWCPAHIYYKQKAIIEINAKCNGCGKCIEACPTKVLELKNNKAEVIKDNLLKCHLCEACQDVCPEGAIKTTPSNDFVFYVESWGQLEPKKIIVEAAKISQEMFDDFTDSIKATK